MAKKRKYSAGYMMTHNGNMGMIKEDFSKPCGIPYGAISREIGNTDYMPLNGYRADDLFEGVEKSMKNDADAIRKMIKPTNW